MSKNCPIYGRALYLDCMECDEKYCKNRKKKYKTICIGVDQSYKNCGVSVSADGELKKIFHIDLRKMKTKTEKRYKLNNELSKIAIAMKGQGEEVVCVIERIRLRSKGFLNFDYIKSMGALNAVVVDTLSYYHIPVYSVDTRCWKSQVVGTSKPKANKLGVPDEKFPTVEWVRKQGPEFLESITYKVVGRKTKNTFLSKDGIRKQIDDDAADSAAISMYWFRGDHDKLQSET